MKELDALIEKEKNKGTQVLGPFINRIKRDSNMITELEESTRYLDIEYDNVPVGQRFYHMWFNEHTIIKCKYCAKNSKFSAYDRFSDKIGKKDSNYYTHCGSVRCLIEDFKERGNSKQGYGALISKISGNADTRKELLLLTSFLDDSYSSISDSQRFYHVFFNKMTLELCEFCKEPKKYGSLNKFSEIIDKKDSNYCRTCVKTNCVSLANIKYSKIGILNKYGVDNIWNIPGYREGLENTNIEKYGVKYYTSSDEFKEKCTEKYNLDWEGKHPTRFKSVQDKKRKTNLEKYGIDCILKDREKIKKRMIEKYGEDHNMKLGDHKNNHRKIMEDKFGGVFMKSDEIKRKSQETNLEKYGYKFATQNEEISEKQFLNSRKFKNYYFPSGKLINIQGFEDKALDILLNRYKEDDIETGRKEITKLVGIFMYNLEGINRRYFPDIYIKSINTIIEVKSEYTFSQDSVKNNLKKLSVENKNINFEYMIFSNDGKKLIS